MFKKEWPYLSLAAGVLLLSFFTRLGDIPIRIWDEGRLAVSAQYMHLHGLSLVPRYDGAPDMWSVKPPLMLWLQALSMNLFGMTEFAVRLPAALSSVAIGLLLYFAGRRLTPRIGLLAVLVFASTYAFVFIHAGRTGDYDALLTLEICLYTFALWRFASVPSARQVYLAGAALTLAVLTKGVAGILFLPGGLLYLLLSKKLLPLLRMKATWLSLVIFIVFVGGYYWGREQINPGYLKSVWENELGGRFMGVLEEHAHPFGWYIDNLFTWRNTFWAPFIVPAFLVGLACRDERIRALSRFLLCVTVPFLLLISLSRTKLDWYDLPLYPFWSLQIAAALHVGWEALQGWTRTDLRPGLRTLFGALLALFLFFIPFSQVYRFIFEFSEKPWDDEPHRIGYFLQEVQRKQNKQLGSFAICYTGYNAQIQFYVHGLNARNIPIGLRPDMNGLWVGEHLVVCQDQWRREAEKLGFTRVDDRFGCTEYIVTQVP